MDTKEINQRVAFYVNLANEKFKLNMAMPSVTFFSSGRAAGKANIAAHQVKFNVVIARDNSDSFENTISHEISHLVTAKIYPNAKQHHGPEFKSVHRALGGTGETYHRMDVSNSFQPKTVSRWIVKCSCSEHQVPPITGKKIAAGATFSCKQCKSKVVFTGKIIKKGSK